jgi:hypothetical protein
MARKKVAEADRLRAEAERLLREQREVLAHAGSVVRDASRELGRYAHDEAYPRLAAGTRHAASNARHKIIDEVLPGVASVIGSTLAAVDSARGTTGKKGSKAAAAAVAALVKKAPKKSGAGKLIGLGVVAVAALGVGYVLWQTFRADDELWVEEDA